MAVLRESPWYYEILQEGIEQGSRETALHNLASVLRHRFGSLPSSLTSRLSLLSAERLQALFDTALEVETLAAFQACLPSNGTASANGQTS